jgi:hypothetical protein
MSSSGIMVELIKERYIRKLSPLDGFKMFFEELPKIKPFVKYRRRRSK